MTGLNVRPSLELDLSGLFCPQVVLRMKEQLDLLAPGTVVEVLSTDPLSAIDVPLFAKRAGHTLTGQTSDHEGLRFSLVVGSGRTAS